MLQIYIQAGLNRFGGGARKEIQYIHDMSDFKPILAKDLFKEERKLALS